MNAKVYSHEGKEIRSIGLSPALFGVKWNPDLAHEVVVGMQANARAGTANTKGRGEVRGGGKKPWRQKGTGRARHGSTRSPIWVGGGVAHGPTSKKNYGVKLNRKVKAKALAMVLAKKHAAAEVLFVEGLPFSAPKTKNALAAIKAIAQGAQAPSLAKKRANAALILLPERDENLELSFRNLGQIAVMPAKDVSPLDLLTYKYVVVAKPEPSLALLEKRVGAVLKKHV
jgi:large subunit ribosomal protein L4